MDSLVRPYFAMIALLSCLGFTSCTSTVQVTHKDPIVGDREITAVGRTGVAVRSGGEGEGNVQIQDRLIQVERSSLVVDGDDVAPIGSDVRRISIIETRGKLSVTADDEPLWSE